jgi:hypothetical protein
MTNYTYKIFLIVPAARVAAVNTWLKTNIDPTGNDWVALVLSSDGEPPYTHGWCCFHATPNQAAAILQRLATVASVTPPDSGWRSLTRQEQRTVFANLKTALRAQGWYIKIGFNDEGEGPRDIDAADNLPLRVKTTL